MAIPSFFSEDGAAIVAEVKADMESRLGKTIAPADIEMLQVNSRAYYRLLWNIAANEAARQNLVAFANGNMLDYLAEQVGVSRLAASSAKCTIVFNMVDGHSGVLLPAGIRIQSNDQKVVFVTEFDVTVNVGDSSKTVIASCTTAGIDGNGYTAGQISLLLDPQPFVSSVSNTDVTNGGADDESDVQLRERIKLAPSSFSVAGPVGAYEFFAKSAHPSIVDVSVTTEAPGQVNIYPLLEGGLLPSTEIINAVNAICNAEKVRPLCDTVVVAAPTSVDYSIEVEIIKYTNAIDENILNTVNANLLAYKNAGLNKLGRDVIREQIAALCMLQGQVYNINLVEPATNIIAGANVFTNCTGITVTITGSNAG